MNREQLMTVTVALACFAALGASATTLASSLATDPDEAVDLNYDLLPIESDEAADLQRQIESNTGGEGGESGSSAGKGDTESADSSSGGESTNSQSSDSSRSEPAAASTSGDTGGSGQSSGLFESDEGSLALTENPVSSLLSTLFPLAVVAALLAVLARYRDRVRALLASDDDRQPGRESPHEGFRSPPRDANDVFATWDALVRSLDVDPDARTPEECVRAAAEADMDAEAVRTLRRTFEEVRYGDRPVTEKRSRRVREVRERLDLGLAATEREAEP